MLWNREKKIRGLTLLRSLVQNHADILMPKLHDVCLVVVEEVRSPLWDKSVHKVVVPTLTDLHILLSKLDMFC